jgi:hypothetical protein
MSEQQEDYFRKFFLPGIAVTLLCAFLIGAFAAHITGSVFMGKVESRLEHVEKSQDVLASELKTIQAQRHVDREAFIRLESKIDLLLQRQFLKEKLP